jgi:hypothetical protein
MARWSVSRPPSANVRRVGCWIGWPAQFPENASKTRYNLRLR